MIESLRHRGLERLFERGDATQIDPRQRNRIVNILNVLDAANTMEDLTIPLWRLYALSGELQGFWSLKVNRTWRIIFKFEDGDVYDVDLVDDH